MYDHYGYYPSHYGHMMYGSPVGLLTGFIALAIYFLPAIVAFTRQRHSSFLILLVNFCLGATGIVWILCLFWAFSGPSGRWAYQDRYPPRAWHRRW